MQRSPLNAAGREFRYRGIFRQALVLYTTGELARRALAHEPAAAADAAGYKPFGYRDVLAERGWGSYQEVLVQYWQPYLDGRLSLESAISRMISSP